MHPILSDCLSVGLSRSFSFNPATELASCLHVYKGLAEIDDMLHARNYRFLNTLKRLVDILPDTTLNTKAEQFYKEHDLLKENEELFPLVAQLYISETCKEANSRFQQILRNGRDAESARKVYYVIHTLFMCGGTQYAELMTSIVDTIGREEFGKRMNWLQKELFTKNWAWNSSTDPYYFFVENFSWEALNADDSSFKGLVATASDRAPKSTPPSALTSRRFVMINTWDTIFNDIHESVPLGGQLLLDLELNGSFVISYGQSHLGIGTLNRYSDGYGNEIDTNPTSAAARLIASEYSTYNIQIFTTQKSVYIEGRNSNSYSEMEKWNGILTHSKMRS